MSDRAALDAYWTPAACALACTQVLASHCAAPELVVEPAVGAGAWVRAARAVWPGATVAGWDLDPAAPGLAELDLAVVGPWTGLGAGRADVILGNPPYAGDLVPWLDASLDSAPVVGYLLRATALGSRTRLPWWRRHPPAEVHVLVPRPRWEGPGARPTSDTVDTLFVVWTGRTAPRRPAVEWLEWAPPGGGS